MIDGRLNTPFRHIRGLHCGLEIGSQREARYLAVDT